MARLILLVALLLSLGLWAGDVQAQEPLEEVSLMYSSPDHLIFNYSWMTLPEGNVGHLWLNDGGAHSINVEVYVSGTLLQAEIDPPLQCTGPVYIAQLWIMGYRDTDIVYELEGVEVSCETVRLPSVYAGAQ